MQELAERLRAGDVRAAARAMRIVDDRRPGYVDLLKQIYPHTGRAWVIGLTGMPGAGKSSLVDKLIEAFRKEGKRVGVVAVDPTSPFSGGAILGDRIRMQKHFLDAGVFIRSLATRGHLGGLSRSAGDVIHVLDAWGADVILVETVGVGQDELEVTRLAHTTVVVMAPGMGDDIQAIKAGILEIADVFAVNKADRDGADATARDLEQMIALGGEVRAAGAHSVGHRGATLDLAAQEVTHGDAWVPPIVRTVAVKSTGIDVLVAACERHQRYVLTTDLGKRRREARAREELTVVFRDLLLQAAEARIGDAMRDAVARIEARTADPYSTSEALVGLVVRPEAS